MSIVVTEAVEDRRSVFRVTARQPDVLTVVEGRAAYIVSQPVLDRVRWVEPLLGFLGFAEVVEDRDIPGGKRDTMRYFLEPGAWPTFHPDAGPRELPGAPGVFVRSCWVGGCEVVPDPLIMALTEGV